MNAGAGSHDAVEHSRRLCIAVDDFGLHGGVCQAALLLADMGRVHAIGCMVGAPEWTKWAPRLKERDGSQVDVGLHLDLTEHPMYSPPRNLSRLIACSWLRTLNRSAVRIEISAQLDAFEQQMGRAPSYVDGHQHVHQFPVVREEMLAELLIRYPRSLPWLRNTSPTCAASADRTAGARHALKPWVIAALGSAALTEAGQRMGFQENTHLLGVHDFSGDEQGYFVLMRRWLRGSMDGDLLMCHPSLLKSSMDPIAAARVSEYHVLSGAAFGSLLRAEGISLQAMSRTLVQNAARGIGPVVAD